MKNLALLFIALIFGAANISANTVANNPVITAINGYGNSFIFDEGGITFSVYPDGEFDFYINNRVGVNANINLGAANITFNSGYNYDPYVQYDDYGAVVQVENVPIYYDYYGRVSGIGNINISYNNGRVYRLGGMYVYYNPNGYYSYHTGFINVYNRYYVYRPYYNYFARPLYNHCVVYNRPYRRYYTPVRYTYYRPYIHNTRKVYAQVGQPYRYNNSRNSRATIYRNDKRVVARDNSVRRNDVVRNSTASNGKTQASRGNNKVQRSNTNVQKNNTGNTSRSNVSRSTTKSNVATAPQRNNNTRTGTVNRSSTTYSKPGNNNVGSAATRASTERTVTARPAQSSSRNNGTTASRSSVRQPASRTATGRSKNNNVASRASVSRSVRKAPSVSSGNDRGTQSSSARRR